MHAGYRSTDDILTKRGNQTRCLLIGCVVIGIASFVIGILIGRFATCPDEKHEEVNGVFLPGVSDKLVMDADPEIQDLLLHNMRSENIRENLRYLSDKPHLAGTEGNHQLGIYLKKFWEEAGLDHVTMTPYNVMLSYPNMSDLNYVELLDENSTSLYKSNLTEPILSPEDNKTGVVPPFNAYSMPGDVKGNLVYVNYGRAQDFAYLDALNISVNGTIVLARYGKIFRGDKVRFAELRGALGIILFSDPQDITAGDTNKVYPDDWWLPPSGTQRGTVYLGDGDPKTPDYPATEHAYRKVDESFYLPKIPCHPIGYGIAIELMRKMRGETVPANWTGGMDVEYRFGNQFEKPGWQAHVKVSTKSQQALTYNVIGVIRGNIEPDRYVLIGNHRDAWVFGALDPSSGTAVMMEIARVMGDLVKTGKWRPRRSIMFCSWGAEEYGLIGSTEWVEHYTKTLGARAIAYLNVDIAVQGNTSLRALGTPLIYKSLYAAAKKASNPNETEIALGRPTVYDTWKFTYPWENKDKPIVSLPGSGSDYAPFRDRLGIPVVDIRYTWDSHKLKLSAYPLYHSMYETFHVVDQIMDRGFKYHTAVGKVWMEMARNLADSLILPFNVTDYADVLADLSTTLLANFGAAMENKTIDTSLLTTAIANFTEGTRRFEQLIQKTNLHDPFAVRRLNDQLMQLDRAFIDPAGLPHRKLKRHILFAESELDNYAGSSFPGLSDSLIAIQMRHEQKDFLWETVKKHYSVILFYIQSATSTLEDVSDFMFDY